jgi:hypothetical protein
MILEIFIEYWRKFINKLNNVSCNRNIHDNGKPKVPYNNKFKVRQYLRVPYAEKDEAKRLGAKWDNQTKSWFIPEGKDSLSFEKWIPQIEQSPYVEPNIRAKGFYLVESKEQCWKCHKVTKVFGFLIPKGNKHIEDIYDEDEGKNSIEWVTFEYDLFITYVKWLNEEALTIMKKFSSNYYYDFSKFIKDKYYINHCQYCGNNQGDHFMFEEPDGAFCPLSIDAAKQIKLYWFEELLEASAGGYAGVNFLEEYMEHNIHQTFYNENKIVASTSQVKRFVYYGGEVSRQVLDAAIDFMVSIEPNPISATADQEFEESRNKYNAEINMVYAAIRQYGYQITDKTLENMQDIFYSITNSDKYLQSLKHQSMVYNLLNYYWDGIEPWKR